MNLYNNKVSTLGYVDEEVPDGIDLVAEIKRLKKEKNAVILGHYYTIPEVQDISDIIGDSLALAQKAYNLDADIVVMAGVYFMGETIKVLSPQKKVLVPDLNAGCSLADSCPADKFKQFKEEHTGYTVISYVNTSAAVKALTDVVVTSSNALKIVNSFPKDEKIIFGPDRNLGSYINAKTGRDMLLWDGACHVHEKFSLQGILDLKKEHPGAKVICHPECPKPIVIVSDYTGSTAAMLTYVKESEADEFIVATESGILHQLELAHPDKKFYAAPPEELEGKVGCGCNNCEYMKLNTLKKIYLALKYEQPEVVVDEEVAKLARRPIDNMLAKSK